MCAGWLRACNQVAGAMMVPAHPPLKRGLGTHWCRSLHSNPRINGVIPSELGLCTRLTSLCVASAAWWLRICMASRSLPACVPPAVKPQTLHAVMPQAGVFAKRLIESGGGLGTGALGAVVSMAPFHLSSRLLLPLSQHCTSYPIPQSQLWRCVMDTAVGCVSPCL